MFVDSEAVPDEWRARALPVFLVPLDRDEAGDLLRSGSTERLIDNEEEELLRLVARGFSARTIARRMGRSERSIHRRLARLRERYGASSTQELATELARKGF